MKTRYPERFHFILGNHELSEMTSYPIMKNGQLLNFLFRLGLEAAYGDGATRVEKAYHAYIRSLPVAIRTPQKILICHSCPEDSQLRNFSASILERELRSTDMARGGGVFELCWGRDYTEKTAREFAQKVGAKVLIHGHEPCEAGFSTPNSHQIIVDCSHRPAAYLTFSLKGPVSYKDVVEGIRTF